MRSVPLGPPSTEEGRGERRLWLVNWERQSAHSPCLHTSHFLPLCVCEYNCAENRERETRREKKKEKRENNYGYINLDLKKENSKRKNQPHYTTTNTHFHHNFHSTYNFHHKNIQFWENQTKKKQREKKRKWNNLKKQIGLEWEWISPIRQAQ